MTQEKEIGEEQFMFDCGSINERRGLPKPERTIVVGIDGGYIRDWIEKRVIFEVIVGKSVPDERDAKCFGFVSSYDTKSKRRFYEHLKTQRMQMSQKTWRLLDLKHQSRIALFLFLKFKSFKVVEVGKLFGVTGHEPTGGCSPTSVILIVSTDRNSGLLTLL